MRLVYLWVEDYRCFKEQGFHFTNRYRISFGRTKEDNSKYQLTFEKNDCYISAESFYGSTFLDFRIFVGENGRGKTALFECLDCVMERLKNYSKYKKKSDIKAVVVFESDTEELIYRMIGWKDDFIDVSKEIKEGTGKIEQSAYVFYNNRNTIEDILLQMSFICDNDESNLGKWLKFPVPKKLLIKVNSYQTFLRKVFSQLIKVSGDVGSSNEAYRTQVFLFEKADALSEKFQPLGDSCTGRMMEVLGVIIMHILTKGRSWRHVDDCKEARNDVEKLFTELLKIDISGEVCKELKRILSDKGEFGQLCGFLDVLDNLNLLNDEKSQIEFSIHNDNSVENKTETIERLKLLYGAYKKIVLLDSNYDFLKFSWEMSSGEYSLLNTFAHIHKFQMEWVQKETTPLLMLDEIDLSLHPRWQQQYLANIIDYLQETDTKKIQLLLATHSPIVLSDVRREFITYLEFHDEHLVESSAKESREKKTFGANIYDLYKDSFFLDFSNAGILGKFVSGKIEEIKNTIKRIDTEIGEKNKGHENAESEKIEEWVCLLRECKLKIDYIDDDVLRRILLNLLNSVIRKVRIKEREDAILYISSMENDEFEELKKSMNEIRMKKERQKIE